MAGMGNLAFAGQGYVDTMSKIANMQYLQAIRRQIIQESIRKQQEALLDRQAMGGALSGIMGDPMEQAGNFSPGNFQPPMMPQSGMTPQPPMGPLGPMSSPMAAGGAIPSAFPMGGPSGPVPTPPGVGQASVPMGPMPGPTQPIGGRLGMGNRMPMNVPLPGVGAMPMPVGGGAPGPEAQAQPPGPALSAPPQSSLYGGQGSPLGPGGAFDLRGLAQRIKRANPGMSDEAVFRSVVKAQALLNPAGKAELALMMQQFKNDIAQERIAAMADRVRMQQEGAMDRTKAQQEGAMARTTAQQEGASARATANQQAVTDRSAATQQAIIDRVRAQQEGAMARTQEQQKGAMERTTAQQEGSMARAQAVQGAITDRSAATQQAITSRVEGTNAAKSADAAANREAAQQRVETNIQGRKDIAAAKTDAKAQASAKSFDEIATEAEALADKIEGDKTLVGLRGTGRAIWSSVGSQLGLSSGDPERADLQTRLSALQQRMRGEVYGSKHFSTGSQAVLNKVLPGLGRLDDATLAVTGLRNVAKALRSDAKGAAAAPAEAAAPGDNLPQVTDRASYDAVPAGAQYLDPQGVKRTKGAK